MDVRLGPELQQALATFQAENGITTMSATARALIQLGLERATAFDGAWRKIAWREGVINGTAAFKQALSTAIDQALTQGGAK